MAEDRLRVTILGCGSSGGVPRIGGEGGAGHWGACDPSNPRNRRRRCSALVERVSDAGVTRVLIDTGPDVREQMLSACVPQVDAVFYTHDHADHIHGLDDMRALALSQQTQVPAWADARTSDVLLNRFEYIFVQPEGSMYPPIMTLHQIGDGPFSADGPGGSVTATPIRLPHGRIEALGFRIGGVAYAPDLHDLPQAAREELRGLDMLIIDALRYTPHPSHAHLDLTLEWIADLRPRRAIVTNLHVDMDYDTLKGALPEGVEPAYDGLTFDSPI